MAYLAEHFAGSHNFSVVVNLGETVSLSVGMSASYL